MSHTISERKREQLQIEYGGRKHWYVEHLERQREGHFAGGVESLIPALSCRRCRPQAPFVRLIRLGPD